MVLKRTLLFGAASLAGSFYINKLKDKSPAEMKDFVVSGTRRVTDAATMLISGKSPEAKAEYDTIKTMMKTGIRADEVPTRLRTRTTNEELNTLDTEIHGTPAPQ